MKKTRELKRKSIDLKPIVPTVSNTPLKNRNVNTDDEAVDITPMSTNHVHELPNLSRPPSIIHEFAHEEEQNEVDIGTHDDEQSRSESSKIGHGKNNTFFDGNFEIQILPASHSNFISIQ